MKLLRRILRLVEDWRVARAKRRREREGERVVREIQRIRDWKPR